MSPANIDRPEAAPRRTSHRLLRIGLAAIGLAVAFRVAVHPAGPTSDDEAVRAALVRGADRLLQLQRADGSFPREEVVGRGDVTVSGRPARALLAAWQVTGDARYLTATRRSAGLITSRLETSGSAGNAKMSETVGSLGNLLLLAEMGQMDADAHAAQLAAEGWRQRFTSEERADGALAARHLMTCRNPTHWLDGSWRNYLLERAADESELARAVGQARWADAYIVEAAEAWAPKHDYDFWTGAAGSMLRALAPVQNAKARRLAGIELALLRNDELAPGIPWNDTPYDSYVYASETTTELQGMLSAGSSEARDAALNGVALLLSRQASHGGWGEVLALQDQVARDGAKDTAPAEMAASETPELDAEAVRALALAVDAPRAQQVMRVAAALRHPHAG